MRGQGDTLQTGLVHGPLMGLCEIQSLKRQGLTSSATQWNSEQDLIKWSVMLLLLTSG